MRFIAVIIASCLAVGGFAQDNTTYPLFAKKGGSQAISQLAATNNGATVPRVELAGAPLISNRDLRVPDGEPLRLTTSTLNGVVDVATTGGSHLIYDGWTLQQACEVNTIYYEPGVPGLPATPAPADPMTIIAGYNRSIVPEESAIYYVLPEYYFKIENPVPGYAAVPFCISNNGTITIRGLVDEYDPPMTIGPIDAYIPQELRIGSNIANGGSMYTLGVSWFGVDNLSDFTNPHTQAIGMVPGGIAGKYLGVDEDVHAGDAVYADSHMHTYGNLEINPRDGSRRVDVGSFFGTSSADTAHAMWQMYTLADGVHWDAISSDPPNTKTGTQQFFLGDPVWVTGQLGATSDINSSATVQAAQLKALPTGTGSGVVWIYGRGTDQEATMQVLSTGNKGAYMRFRRPGASGSSASGSTVQISGTGSGGAFIADDAAQDTVIVFSNGNATYKMNGVVEGRIASGSTTNPTAGAYMQSPSYKAAIATKTSAYTVTDTDSTILVNAVSAPVTISLPNPATANTGELWTIKKIDSSANAVTIQCVDGTSLIDGAASQSSTTQWAVWTVQSDGSAYYVVN